MGMKKRNKHTFTRGDKVIHKYSEDESMIGTISSVSGDRCLVSFFIPGRKNKGYTTEIEFDVSELEPCFIDVNSIKRNQ